MKSYSEAPYRKTTEATVQSDSRRHEYRREGSADSVLSGGTGSKSLACAASAATRRENSVDSILSVDRRRREYGRDGSVDSIDSERLMGGAGVPERRSSGDRGRRKSKEFLVRGVWMSEAVDASRLGPGGERRVRNVSPAGGGGGGRRNLSPSGGGGLVERLGRFPAGGGGAPGGEGSFDVVESERFAANRLSQYRAGYAFGSERLAAMTRQIRDARVTPETCV